MSDLSLPLINFWWLGNRGKKAKFISFELCKINNVKIY